MYVKEKYNIAISTITTDNANNMIKSIKELGNNISNVRCMNHSLQLSINEAIKKNELVKKYIQ